jgi:hypothetical protein
MENLSTKPSEKCTRGEITKSIRLGLTRELLERIRAEAKSRNVSVNELVRTAIEQLLGMERLLTKPSEKWARGEKEYAHKVLMEHFAEDRNEVIRFNEPGRWPRY